MDIAHQDEIKNIDNAISYVSTAKLYFITSIYGSQIIIKNLIPQLEKNVIKTCLYKWITCTRIYINKY